MPFMGKRGPKPKGKVKIGWSPDFAYAIGLIVTDGCLSGNGRIIDFTSNDLEQIENFCKALKITCTIGQKSSGSNKNKTYRVQVGDVLFYQFLTTLGITTRKSKTIASVKIPDAYFFDFLRGSFDGDGSFYSYWDKRWRSSYLFYASFVSASKAHVEWLQNEIAKRLQVRGHITHAQATSCYQLKFAKSDSRIMLDAIYYSPNVLCLSRKRLKVEKALAIMTRPQ
ncbi:MAG: hypothetical protein A2542_04025 [Parcubacteria group bacterium RIFOXYD2_FULL_52_8]|nr:MAG: hypothetical protein A2542_04025 [Parcubacteria group bacterium RIFOXYD2_FULL_52_8]